MMIDAPSGPAFTILLAILVGAIALGTPGCGSGAPFQSVERYDFADDCRMAPLGTMRARMLSTPPDTQQTFRLHLDKPARLTFETAYHVPETAGLQGLLVFEVRARTGIFPETLFRSEIRLGPDRPARGREPATVDLGTLAGKDLALTFRTSFEGGSPLPEDAAVGWIRPQIRPPGQPGAADRPSVIVWLVDTQREDHMGCYGYHRATTPHADAFAREAVQFGNMLANASWTKASIASLFTGLQPSTHGAVGRTDRLLPGVTTLAQVLRDAGYRTAAFSSNAVFHAEGWDVCRGFEEVHTYSVSRRREGARTLEILADLSTWLETVGDDPLFLFVHTEDPHAPYHPPQGYNRLFSGGYGGRFARSVNDPRQLARVATPKELRQFVALYDSEIAFGDHCFGRFTGLLKQRGLYEPSYVIYLSDHGEELFDHRKWGHGQALYEELVRIPFLLRLPSGRMAGTRPAGRAGSIDMMPSLLEWLGIEGPAGQGQSFAGAVDAGRDIDAAEVLAEEALDRDRLYSLTSGRFKYILRLNPQREEALYDLEADPAERRNILKSRPEAAAMAAHVAAYRKSAERGTRVVLVDPSGKPVSGSIEARSMITAVQGINLGSNQGVTYGFSDNQQQLWFKFKTGKGPRGIMFDLERPDLGATLDLEHWTGNREWPIFLGEGMRQAAGGQVELTGPELLAGPDQSMDLMTKPGCYIWRVPGGADMGPAELSDREKENLRALGYIE